MIAREERRTFSFILYILKYSGAEKKMELKESKRPQLGFSYTAGPQETFV